MTNISAILQISTLKEAKKSSESARLSVFKLLNGYIITTGTWELYGGFMYTDYFHEAYDLNSLWFWLDNWCENYLEGFFEETKSYEVEYTKGDYPDIIYRQRSGGRRFTIAYRVENLGEIVDLTVQIAEKHLLKKLSQITVAEAI